MARPRPQTPRVPHDVRKGLYKRPLDLSILVVAHIVLFPLWLALWILIPLMIWAHDRGPVFYRQTRVGRDGRVFWLVKFRTMIPNAETTTGPVWASASDPRITSFGRLLRKTALDELPQVFNIWRGDMSFVGPRSERPELHEQFADDIPGFEDRLVVRPGLTGLAQVEGAYDLSPEEKLEFDMAYIQRMSPWLDTRLLFKSVLNTLFGRWDHRPMDGEDRE